MTDVLVARESFAAEVNGENIVIQAGERVSAEHQLARANPEKFKPADDGLAFGVEQATAGPGEKRAKRGRPRKDVDAREVPKDDPPVAKDEPPAPEPQKPEQPKDEPAKPDKPQADKPAGLTNAGTKKS